MIHYEYHMELHDLVINITAIVLGCTLLYFNRKASHTLAGSFFKQYYNFSMWAIVLLILSFASRFLVFAKMAAIPNEVLHYALLIFAGVLFVLTSIALPKEASAYMQQQEKKDVS
jgi:hypothetical protein